MGKRIYIPNKEKLIREILEEAHCSVYATHPGSTKMYQEFERELLVERDEEGHCRIYFQVFGVSRSEEHTSEPSHSGESRMPSSA